MTWCALVLAGGRGRRLGGLDKPALRVGARTMLERVLAAVADADPRVVVGATPPLPPGVLTAREQPPGGGPVAALAAGLPQLPAAGDVALLAADLPFVTGAVLGRLRSSIGRADGAVLVDAEGRDQRLLGVWRLPALRAAVHAVARPAGAALHRTLAGLDVVRVPWEVPPGDPPPWWDCDDPADLARAREWVGDERTE